MRNETEKMHKILTSPEAQKIIDFVSPVYGEAYVGLSLFQAIGTVLDDIDQFPERMKDQLVLQLVSEEWAMEYWEEQYRSDPQNSWTMEQRRQNLLEKIKNHYYNPKKIEDTLAALTGYTVVLTEHLAKNKFGVFVQGYVKDQTKIREFLNQVKPAHLIYEIKMSELIETETTTYLGSCISEHEHYEITVMN